MMVLNIIVASVVVGCIIAEVKAIKETKAVNKEMEVYRAMVMDTKISNEELEKKAAEIRNMR